MCYFEKFLQQNTVFNRQQKTLKQQNTLKQQKTPKKQKTPKNKKSLRYALDPLVEGALYQLSCRKINLKAQQVGLLTLSPMILQSR